MFCSDIWSIGFQEPGIKYHYDNSDDDVSRRRFSITIHVRDGINGSFLTSEPIYGPFFDPIRSTGPDLSIEWKSYYWDDKGWKVIIKKFQKKNEVEQQIHMYPSFHNQCTPYEICHFSGAP